MQEISSKACRLRPNLPSGQRAEQHAGSRYPDHPVLQKQMYRHLMLGPLHSHCQLFVGLLFLLDRTVYVRPLLTFHELFIVTRVMTMHAIHAVIHI